MIEKSNFTVELTDKQLETLAVIMHEFKDYNRGDKSMSNAVEKCICSLDVAYLIKTTAIVNSNAT